MSRLAGVSRAAFTERTGSSQLLQTQWRRVVWDLDLEDFGSERNVDFDLREAKRQVGWDGVERSRTADGRPGANSS
jgi:hypothetical protein